MRSSVISLVAAMARRMALDLSELGRVNVIRCLPSRALAALYPPTCVLCGAPGQDTLDLCRGCHRDLPVEYHNCSRCAQPLPDAVLEGALCGACQSRPPPFERCHTAFRYEDPLPALVAGAKFRARMDYIRLLGRCLSISLRERGAEMPDVILPIPLHRKRLGKRGYNQALEIARTIQNEFAIPVDAGTCVRAVHTAPQTGLDQEQRQRNVRGAFRITKPIDAELVAIVDDVLTTGSTVSEVARVLLAGGVGRVHVWAVARTP